MFIGLTSEDNGGAISVGSARSLALVGTLIKGCSSSSKAGGLYDSSCSSVAISRSCTSSCTSSEQGCCASHYSVSSFGGLEHSSSSFIISASSAPELIQFNSIKMPTDKDCNASSNKVSSRILDLETSSVGIRVKRDNFFNNSCSSQSFWCGSGAHEFNEVNFVGNHGNDNFFCFYRDCLGVAVVKCVFIGNTGMSFLGISVKECVSFGNSFMISGFEANQRPGTLNVFPNNPCERRSFPFSFKKQRKK